MVVEPSLLRRWILVLKPYQDTASRIPIAMVILSSPSPHGSEPTSKIS